ncbi:MAG: tRNA-dihydrouridine synthase family protein [Bacteroidota bacterium]
MNKETKIYFAPFQGITNATFRAVYARHFPGIDALFTPFFLNISSENKLPAKKAIELENLCENGIEVIPQILSKDADEIIRFARFCKTKGFKEINWNLGCPYPQVADKKRGSGLLPFPQEIEAILNRVMAEVEIRFSVKCRLGYYSSDEIFALIPVFNDLHIAELTIHSRIGKQLYAGQSDIDTFAKALSMLNVPVVYNGDIFTLEDFYKVETKLEHINAWMIGRGILSDPFLPASIKGITVETDKSKRIKSFITDLYLSYRKTMNDRLTALSILKEYWQHLSLSFDNPHKVFRKIKRCKTFDEYENNVAEIFTEYQWIRI